jgi:hypothetical protein
MVAAQIKDELPLQRQQKEANVRSGGAKNKTGNQKSISKHIAGGGTVLCCYSVNVGTLRNQEFANFKATLLGSEN